MGVWINLIQSVSQHTYRFKTLLKGIAMCTDVNAIGQSADNQHLWTHGAQVADEASYHILSVDGTMPCAHNVQHIALVEVGTTFII